MIKLLILIFITFNYCYSQVDRSDFHFKRNNVREVFYYNIDGLFLKKYVPTGKVFLYGKNMVVDSVLKSEFEFEKKDFIKFKLIQDTTFIQTNIVFVLDSLVLSKKDIKKKYLSGVDQSKILSIERLNNDNAIKQYGELGKKGIVIIKTKSE